VVEIAGPLSCERLGELLASRGFDPDAYSLTGGHPNECYVLDHRGDEWVVYYSGRGLEVKLRSFPTEDLACRHLADLLWEDRGVRRGHD
jgi:hypothetical protein